VVAPSDKMSAAPQLRGLLASQTKKQLFGCLLLTGITVSSFKFLVVDPRKKKYEEFYKYITNVIHILLF